MSTGFYITVTALYLSMLVMILLAMVYIGKDTSGDNDSTNND